MKTLISCGHISRLSKMKVVFLFVDNRVCYSGKSLVMFPEEFSLRNINNWPSADLWQGHILHQRMPSCLLAVQIRLKQRCMQPYTPLGELHLFIASTDGGCVEREQQPCQIVAPLTGLFPVPCLLNLSGQQKPNTRNSVFVWYLHPSCKSTKGRIWCNSVGHQVAILKIRKYF